MIVTFFIAIGDIVKTMRLFLWMSCLTGVLYPLLITLLSQLTMPHRANGSFIYLGEKITGSALIAQKFESENYFWPRPSSIDYNPLPSGGSNLSPTTQALKEIVEERSQHLKMDSTLPPKEMLFSSGSGVDPHISLSCAYFQMERVAKARGIDPHILKNLIDTQSLGYFGEPYVNVLLLNQAIDSTSSESE